jgi:hypothetical protein
MWPVLELVEGGSRSRSQRAYCGERLSLPLHSFLGRRDEVARPGAGHASRRDTANEQWRNWQ